MPTYREMLLDPRWQKKRLEVLESANWSCEHCGDDETTLHVHHKRYVKGRKPWEYERAELMSLCAPCHEEHHEAKTALDTLVAFSTPYCMQGAVSVLGGYFDAAMDTTKEIADACMRRDPLSFYAGALAQIIESGGLDFERKIAEACREWFPDEAFTPPQRAALDALTALREDEV